MPARESPPPTGHQRPESRIALSGHVRAFALQNRLVLRGEWAAAVLLGLTALLVVAFRLILQGRLPEQIGRDGVGWGPEAIEQLKGDVVTAKESVASLQLQIDALEAIVRAN